MKNVINPEIVRLERNNIGTVQFYTVQIELK